jgi:hypothetical protein
MLALAALFLLHIVLGRDAGFSVYLPFSGRQFAVLNDGDYFYAQYFDPDGWDFSGYRFFSASPLPVGQGVLAPFSSSSNFCGFVVTRGCLCGMQRNLGYTYFAGTQIQSPAVLIIGLLATIGSLLFWPWRRIEILAGCCLRCGYDLRAHRPGQRCPECGTPIPLDKTRDRPPGEDLKPPETDPPAEPLGPA